MNDSPERVSIGDTSGFDLEVLKGGLYTIEKFRPSIFSEYAPVGDKNYINEAMLLFSKLESLGVSFSDS